MVETLEKAVGPGLWIVDDFRWFLYWRKNKPVLGQTRFPLLEGPLSESFVDDFDQRGAVLPTGIKGGESRIVF